eukprot:CAMPEP_0167771768 /NCGR_PEP_ID=MMETSP0111_2-20121227/466_1 /TAXON_ID=91324 /ORGANISM="Lotharella globosa, Strain CCCM811" /LENGTH=312 /DNA_ID=CAMNT_0007661167 /DNA_START=32 /DNA_END=967 /DNA_ORIENTATION=+
MLTPPSPSPSLNGTTAAKSPRVEKSVSEVSPGGKSELKAGRVLGEGELRAVLRKFNKKDRQISELRERLAAAEVGTEAKRAIEQEVIEDQKRRIRQLVIKADRLELKVKLMKDVMFKMKEKRQDVGDKNQSLFYNFLVGAPEHPLAKEVRLLQEVLQDKIRENEVSATMLHEAKHAHKDAVKHINQALHNARGMARTKHNQWLEATKRVGTLDAQLHSLKQAHEDAESTLKSELAEMERRMARQATESKKHSTQLTLSLKHLQTRYAEKIVFDDSRYPQLRALNLQPYDLRTTRAVATALQAIASVSAELHA